MYISLKLGVFGINGKVFENAKEWCLCHSYILDTVQVIQVSNLEFFYFVTFWWHFAIVSIICIDLY